MTDVYKDASRVTNHDGLVQVDCADGFSFTFTPEAAAKTGAQMIQNAAAAKGEEELEADRVKRAAKG
jgi:hypothetical protein